MMHENQLFSERKTSKMTEFYFRGPDLQCKTPEMGTPSCEIKKEKSKDSLRGRGKQIRTEDKEFFESKVLKNKSKIALQLPLPL